jgi:hypothetical protein
LQRACALVGQRPASRFRRFLSRSPAGETARFEVCHRRCIACSWHHIIAGAGQAGVSTRFGVGTRSAWLMRRRPRTLAESVPATLTRIFETLVCRVFRTCGDSRPFMSPAIREMNTRVPSRLKRRTGTRLRDNRSPPPVSHRRPEGRDTDQPSLEVKFEVRNGAPRCTGIHLDAKAQGREVPQSDMG